MKQLDLSVPITIPADDHQAWRSHLAERLMQAELAVLERDREIALLRTRLELADALRNQERQKALPPDVLTVQAKARILDWEGSRGIVAPARYEGKHPALAAPYGKDESK